MSSIFSSIGEDAYPADNRKDGRSGGHALSVYISLKSRAVDVE